jgi:hypothetical protein
MMSQLQEQLPQRVLKRVRWEKNEHEATIKYSPERSDEDLALAASRVFSRYFPQAIVTYAYVNFKQDPKRGRCSASLDGLSLKEFEAIMAKPVVEGLNKNYAVQFGYEGNYNNDNGKYLSAHLTVSSSSQAKKVVKRFIEVKITPWSERNESLFNELIKELSSI